MKICQTVLVMERTRKLLTDRQTDTHTHTHTHTQRKDKNIIPPSHTSYAGGIIIYVRREKLVWLNHVNFVATELLVTK